MLSIWSQGVYLAAQLLFELQTSFCVRFPGFGSLLTTHEARCSREKIVVVTWVGRPA